MHAYPDNLNKPLLNNQNICILQRKEYNHFKFGALILCQITLPPLLMVELALYWLYVLSQNGQR